MTNSQFLPGMQYPQQYELVNSCRPKCQQNCQTACQFRNYSPFQCQAACQQTCAQTCGFQDQRQIQQQQVQQQQLEQFQSKQQGRAPFEENQVNGNLRTGEPMRCIPVCMPLCLKECTEDTESKPYQNNVPQQPNKIPAQQQQNTMLPDQQQPTVKVELLPLTGQTTSCMDTCNGYEYRSRNAFQFGFY